MKLSWLPVVIKIKMEKKERCDAHWQEPNWEFCSQKKLYYATGATVTLHVSACKDCSPFPVISST